VVVGLSALWVGAGATHARQNPTRTAMLTTVTSKPHTAM
jgi:hypothetical protein